MLPSTEVLAQNNAQNNTAMSNIAAIAFHGLLLFVGGFLLSLVVESNDPLVFSTFAFISQVFLEILTPKQWDHEVRTFTLLFSWCFCLVGLAQYYSLVTEHQVMTISDAHTFYEMSTRHNESTLTDLETMVNAPLAVYVWQKFYAIAHWFGGNYAPWIGIIVNCNLVALSGVFTVRIGRNLFPEDHTKLRRIAILFAFCGNFWMFGALFLRDSYALLVNVISLWLFVRFFRRRSFSKLVWTLVGIGLCTLTVWYIRQEMAMLFIPLTLMFFAILLVSEKFNGFHILALSLGLLLLVLLFSTLTEYLQLSAGFAFERQEQYGNFGRVGARQNSLGVAYILNQSLPIRVLAGTIYVILFPIPIWGYLYPGAFAYHIFKNVNCLFLNIMLPTAVMHIYLIIRNFRTGSREYLYIALYFIATTLMVAATSLETRHHGSFLHAFILLVAGFDSSERETKRKLNLVRFAWFLAILLLHALWITLRIRQG